MSYNQSSTQTSRVDQAIAGVLVAGVTFILGYTVVRASLAQSATESATESTTAANNDVEVVIPHEGALWADFSTQF